MNFGDIYLSLGVYFILIFRKGWKRVWFYYQFRREFRWVLNIVNLEVVLGLESFRFFRNYIFFLVYGNKNKLMGV